MPGSSSGAKCPLLLSAASLLWLAAVALGMRLILIYDFTPGLQAKHLSTWAPNTSLKLAPSKATLILIAHPRCPCTRASIAELARIMARVQTRVEANVLFYKPANFSTEWEKTEL